LFLNPHVAFAQVTIMDKVPTLAELQAALKITPPAADASSASAQANSTAARMRGIVVRPNQSEPSASAQAIEVAAVSKGRVTNPPKALEIQQTSSAKSAEQTPGPAIAMRIMFQKNSSDIAPSSMGYINSIARLLESDAGLHLVIEGHTDAKGGPQVNLPLSWERALSVYHVLIEECGINANRLRPVGKGSSEPLEGVPPTATSNRRVQFRVMS
jgi:outer membrane protein OmpA-like peptidoglycan-associated protein